MNKNTKNLSLTASQIFSSERKTFILIFIVALLMRLYGLSNPLTDGGHERQTQVAMIARNLFRDNLNIFYPRMDTFAPSVGYTMLEFPLQPAVIASFYYVFGVHDVIGRIVTIVFAMGSVWLFYRLAQYLISPRFALIATAVYSLTPLNVYFGRILFPEAVLLFFMIGAMYFLFRYYQTHRLSHWGLSALFAATACLVKPPPALAMLLPILCIWLHLWGRVVIRQLQFYSYYLIALLPLLLWALWARHIGTPDSDPTWNPYQWAALERWGVPHAWFKFEFYKFVGRSLVFFAWTPLVTVLIILGVKFARGRSDAVLLYSWAIAMFIYVILTPGAQATHWNYQVPLIPIGAIFAGVALEELYKRSVLERMHLWLTARRCVYVLILAFMILFHGAIYVAMAVDAYNYQRRSPYAQEVGELVQREFGREGFIIVLQPFMLPATQAYFMDRRVHYIPALQNEDTHLEIEDIARWIPEGAIGVVVVNTPYGRGTKLLENNPQVLEYIRTNFMPVVENSNYLVYKIKKG